MYFYSLLAEASFAADTGYWLPECNRPALLACIIECVGGGETQDSPRGEAVTTLAKTLLSPA